MFASWKSLIKPMKHAAYWSTVAIKARMSNDRMHALITWPDKNIARAFEAEWTAAPAPGFEDISARAPHEKRTATGVWIPPASGTVIASWNINGRLALKLCQPDFCKIIEKCDIVLLQETHLTPGQEDALRLPHGYHIQAISREPDRMSLPHGGVAIVYKSCFQPTLCKQWSAVDFMVLDFGSFLLANVYAPPVSSPWQRWSHVHPMQCLSELCAATTCSPDKPLLTFGDFNARTGCLTPSPHHPPRVSADQTEDTRGRDLMRLCATYQLAMLNGVMRYGASSTLMTSH
ncbi:hypothetical protein M422DRAFT_68979 [Sphaerobolus stellatus SS14]|uniref:Unplaced genomic scaffold SPHSTscaffold_82, whole genome shotgun sequence n=1 Tax=Sphaerobolus stellatus (strain SS14) TaxID=990650 RepID=A0A0C9VB99_SPHS4|nr:hypothetical protein M422DRAFT_68979 [Sphaerobolus stellatus SS14]